MSEYKSTHRNIKGKRTQVLQHRIVMEEILGRRLGLNEQVHHVNHDKKDNRIENLELVDIKDHARLHSLEYWVKHAYVPTKKRYCQMCGTEIAYVKKYGRKWFEKSKFCGIMCNIKNARQHQTQYMPSKY